MTSPVSECDTKNTDLSKLGSYRISDTAQYSNIIKYLSFTIYKVNQRKIVSVAMYMWRERQ